MLIKGTHRGVHVATATPLDSMVAIVLVLEIKEMAELNVF